jgi:pilus assembly protein CpaF
VLAGDNISARFVVPTVATSVDLVVHLGVGADGVRRVNEIVSVPGRVEADVIEVEPIFVRGASELRRTGGVPARVERYERVGIDIHEVLAVDRGSGEL